MLSFGRPIVKCTPKELRILIRLIYKSPPQKPGALEHYTAPAILDHDHIDLITLYFISKKVGDTVNSQKH